MIAIKYNSDMLEKIHKPIIVGDSVLDLNTPVVMGILNVTPDSFFEHSRNFSHDAAENRVRQIIEQGAAIVDIGGYSSRPGADDVTPEEELRRVLAGAEIVRRVAPGMIISVDTFRASVARGVLESVGACIINDISAGELDPAIVDVVAEFGVPYIAMHMRGTPVDMQQQTEYSDIVADVADYLAGRVAYLRERGIKDVILDPGFGFAKTTAQNYELLASMDKVMIDDLPVLAGISRKSMIYKVLETTPVEALAGTTALHWECLRKGAAILRVHDVREAADVVKLFEYYKRYGKA